MPIKSFTCKSCGVEFKRQHKRSTPIMYCSRTCWRAGRSGKNYYAWNAKPVKCLHCGKETYKRKYLIEQGNGKYCSRKCAASHTAKEVCAKRKNGKTISCHFCKKLVYKNKARLGNRNFCGVRCIGKYKKSKRLVLTCAYCGKKKKVKPSYIEKNVKCCSIQCSKRYSGETSLEMLGYALLGEMKFKFIKQYRLGKFFPDAFIPSMNMAVQFDGDYWHSKKEHLDRDERFNRFAKSIGVNVVRVGESELKKSFNALRQKIIAAAQLRDDQVPLISQSFSPPKYRYAGIQLRLNI